MRLGDSLNSYINFCQSSLTKNLLTLVRRSPHSHSSASCWSLTSCTNTSWSTTLPRWARLFLELNHTSN